MTFQKLLTQLVYQGATDIHLHAGLPVMAKVKGELRAFGNSNLSPDFTASLLDFFCDDQQKARFAVQRQVDVAYSVAGFSRFRVNLFRQRGSVSVILRLIESDQAQLQKVDLDPAHIAHFCAQTKGLVILCGPMNSGKSTTLSRLVDEINQHYKRIVITIEDPIEYMHRPKQAIVLQRELGADVLSPNAAITAAMRQNPDVIVVGEIRDQATATAVLEAAQSGKLVLTSLNAPNFARGFQRMLEFFSHEDRAMARISLSESLLGIIAQRLLPGLGGKRIGNFEVLHVTPEIRARLKNTHLIPNLYEALWDFGVQTFDHHLAELYRQGRIDLQTASASASSPESLKALLDNLDAEVGEGSGV